MIIINLVFLEIRFDNPKYVGQDTTSSRVDDYTKNEIYNRLKLYVVVEGKDGYDKVKKLSKILSVKMPLRLIAYAHDRV